MLKSVKLAPSLLPRWENDCDDCVYLGRSHSGKRDVWICVHDRQHESDVILRDGPDGSYATLPLFLVENVKREIWTVEEPIIRHSEWVDAVEKTNAYLAAECRWALSVVCKGDEA